MKRFLAALLAAMMLTTTAFAAATDAPDFRGYVIRSRPSRVLEQKPMAGGYVSSPIFTEHYGDSLPIKFLSGKKFT